MVHNTYSCGSVFHPETKTLGNVEIQGNKTISPLNQIVARESQVMCFDRVLLFP